MTPRARAWLAAAASVVGFALGAFARMNAAYGPFNLSADPGDLALLWELLRHGQVTLRVVAEAATLGLAAAVAAGLLVARAIRRRPPR